MEVIEKKDIHALVEKDLKKYKKVIILGKGKTFKKTLSSDKEKDTFIICINNTINFCEIYDMLVVNDVISWDYINEEKIKDLKYVLSPVKPHINGKPGKYNTEHVIDKLKIKKFSGKIIFYNLKTSPNNKNFISLDSSISGSNNAVDFICKYLNIDILETRGIGNLNSSFYNDIFEKTEGYYNYDNIYLSRINNHIQNNTKKNNIKYIQK